MGKRSVGVDVRVPVTTLTLRFRMMKRPRALTLTPPLSLFSPQDGVIPVDYPVYVGGDSGTSVVATGDYDGDGYLDVLMLRADGRSVLIAYMSGLAIRETASLPLADDPDWIVVE